jgi:hypothetical protein
MAAEWFPVDVSLDTKPEVQELVDLTGEPVEVIVFRLLKLWGWVQLNTADGRFRSTPVRLGRICGGEASFWEAVASVGWLIFDGETAQIPKWEERFGGAAKRRALKNRRQDKWRRTGGADVDAREAQVRLQARLPQDITEQDITEEDIQAAPVATSDPPKRRKRSQPPDAVSWSADAGWHGITDADRSEWSKAFPGALLDQELAKATAWLHANPERAGKRKWRAFIVRWLGKCQERGGTNRTPGNRPEDVAKRAALERKAREFSEYRPAGYRTPKEVTALAAGMKLKEEDL